MSRYSINSEPTVWDGTAELHKSASGTPAPAPELELSDEWSPRVIPDFFKGTVDGFRNGIHQRRRDDGRIEAQAWAVAITDHEQALSSDVYILREDADEKTFMPSASNVFPIRDLTNAAAAERATRVALARASMTKDERSPIDMIKICQDLAKKAQRIERDWKLEQERLAEEKRLDDEAIALYRIWERGKALLKKAGQP